MNDDTTVSHPILKVASVVAVTIGGLTWGEIAQIMASIYTLCLITEWVWKIPGHREGPVPIGFQLPPTR